MKLLKTERCPSCAKDGKDKHGDNLACYSDGHKYCYSCGYVECGNGVQRFRENNRTDEKSDDGNNTTVLFLPNDSDNIYPTRALEWVEQYGLHKNDLLRNHVVWSEYWKRLIFPIFDETGLLGYQGRYFGDDPTVKKWFGKGDLQDIFHILYAKNQTSVVLVEDIISALKLQKVGHTAMPLFGAHISYQRLVRLSRFFKKVIIWLDPDKRKEAIVFSRLANTVGLECQIIFSDTDPKDCTASEIQEKLK